MHAKQLRRLLLTNEHSIHFDSVIVYIFANMYPVWHFGTHLPSYVNWPMVVLQSQVPVAVVLYGLMHSRQILGPEHRLQLVGHVPDLTNKLLNPK